MRHLHFNEMAKLEWTFRYSEPTREQNLAAASIMAAYHALVMDKTEKDRRMIIATLRGEIKRKP